MVGLFLISPLPASPGVSATFLPFVTTPVTVSFLLLLEYVSSSACTLALLPSWKDVLVMGPFFVQVPSWPTGVRWGYVTGFKAWTVRGCNMCDFVAKGVNGLPALSRPYVKVASQFGGPVPSWHAWITMRSKAPENPSWTPSMSENMFPSH